MSDSLAWGSVPRKHTALGLFFQMALEREDNLTYSRNPYLRLVLVTCWSLLVALRWSDGPKLPGMEGCGGVCKSPFSSDALHHLNASQHAAPPLPHEAVSAEVILAGQEVELDHAEHPMAILDKHTEPGKQTKTHSQTGLMQSCLY